MAARPRFSEDDAYLFHGRKTAAIHYTPFPAHLLGQLARLSRLLRHAPNEAEAAWLNAQIDALTSEGACCPPVAVRKVRAVRRDRPARHETKYMVRSSGPRNVSGKARS